MTPAIAGPSRTTAHSPVKPLNAADVRIVAAEICNQVEKLDDVAEAIRIGREWDDDVRGVLSVRLGDGPMLTPLLEQTIGARIRSRASPRACRDCHAIRNKEALANPEAPSPAPDLRNSGPEAVTSPQSRRARRPAVVRHGTHPSAFRSRSRFFENIG